MWTGNQERIQQLRIAGELCDGETRKVPDSGDAASPGNPGAGRGSQVGGELALTLCHEDFISQLCQVCQLCNSLSLTYMELELWRVFTMKEFMYLKWFCWAEAGTHCREEKRQGPGFQSVVFGREKLPTRTWAIVVWMRWKGCRRPSFFLWLACILTDFSLEIISLFK